MSLRVNMTKINAGKLNSLLKTGDPSIKDSVKEMVQNSFFDDATGAKAYDLACQILDGQPQIEVEDDLVVSVIVIIARVQQPFETQTVFSFWAELFGLAQQKKMVPKLWIPFFVGRPELGQQMQSDWTIYALFSHREACAIFDQVRKFPNVNQIWEYGDADKWMTEVEESGSDVLFFAN